MASIRFHIARDHDPIVIDDISVRLPKRSRMVLVVLALAANNVVTIDRLIDVLWGDYAPKSPRNSIARFVADLRKGLGQYAERLESTTGGYRLVIHDHELDVAIVQRGLEALGSADTTANRAEQTTELRELSNLIGTTPNSILADLDDYAAERSHTELRISVTEALAEALHHGQNYSELIGLLESAVVDHRYHERFWLLLVLAFEDTGRKAEALSAVRRFKAALDELGVAPLDAFQELEDRITSDLHPSIDAPKKPTPLTSVDIPTHQIPNPESSLIGRIQDVRHVHGLLVNEGAIKRMVTIIGLGGSGKTRVALATIAALSASETPVYQLSLQATTDSALVIPLIAQVLGVPSPAGSDAVSLAEAIDQQRFVLVLDNCEHLIDTCREVVQTLLNMCPAVQVLATSREALGVDDETAYLLPSLSLADNDGNINRSAAAELFIERAGLGDTVNESQDLDRINQICARLGALPLAIEVAAAQLAYMEVPQLLERIEASLDSNRGGTNEPAVSTVADVLEWTWRSLSPSQQALLARLSVFHSGWTVESAEAVRAGPGSLQADIDRLVANSLVAISSYRGTTRYDMLTPVREFANEQLHARGEVEIMENRLVEWAQRLADRYSFPQHHLWHHPNAEMLPEHGNLMVAMTHLYAQGRTQELVMLAIATSGMMVNSGFAHDVIRWLEPYLEDSDIPDEYRSAAHIAIGTAKHAVGDLDEVSHTGERALELAHGEPHDWIPIAAGFFSVWALVAPASHTSDELSALAMHAAENSKSRRLNLAVHYLYRAHVEFVARNYEESLVLFREARSLVDHPGRGMLVIEIGESLSLFMLGRHDEALVSVDNWESEPDTDHWHYILNVFRAIVVGGSGYPDRATSELADAVRALPPATTWGRAGIIQTAFAILADLRGEHDLATDLFASAINRDILLLSVAISHVMNQRGLSGEQAWLEVGIEFWARVAPEGGMPAAAEGAPQLLTWWRTGETS